MPLISDWKNWCQTCGKNHLLNLDCYTKWDSLDKDSLEIMRKLTPIETEMIESGNICIDCRKFLKEIVRFSKQCRKITDMYAEINLDYDCDLLTVRSRYGLKDDGEDKDELLSLKNPFENEDNLFNPNELVKLEIKLEDIQENVDPEYIFTNSINSNEMDSDTWYVSPIEKKNTKLNSTRTERQEDKMQLLSIEILNNTEDFLCDTVSYYDYHGRATDNNLKNENNTKLLRQNSAKVGKINKSVKKRITYEISCHICRSLFKDNLELGIHMDANHSTFDYPFDCLKCPKRFAKAKGLTMHARVHSVGLNTATKDKFTFVCDHCGKRCASNADLGEHLSIHSDDHPYECTKCQKKFKHLYRLRRHEKIHSGIIHTCDICDQRFIKKDSMRTHMVMHSEIKKYKCNYCAKEFKRTKALKMHLINHIGLKPYKCMFCDKSFTYGDSCRMHKRKVHPKELAEFKASGAILPFTNLPKIEHLQCYNQNALHNILNNRNKS